MKGGVCDGTPPFVVSLAMLQSVMNTIMEDPKNTKNDRKEKESPELKEELTADELKGVDGAGGVTQQQEELNAELDQEGAMLGGL